MEIGLGLVYFSLPFHTLLDHLFECLILRNKQIMHFSKVLREGLHFIVLPLVSIVVGFREYDLL